MSSNQLLVTGYAVTSRWYGYISVMSKGSIVPEKYKNENICPFDKCSLCSIQKHQYKEKFLS